MDTTPDKIRKSFTGVCKAIFGQETGDIESFSQFLSNNMEPLALKKSKISGKEVICSSPALDWASGFISNNEMAEYNKKMAGIKIDINSIKDIDSILQSIGENLYYCGNNFIGNCHEVSCSDSIVNSSFVYQSMQVYDSKFVAYSSLIRNSDHIFGTNMAEESNFNLCCHDTYILTRAFECLRTYTSSDCFYCANLEGCSNCLFSFNQRNSNYLIGNNPLEKQKFLDVKNKLIRDIMSDFDKSRKTLSIFDVMGCSIE